MRIVHVVILGGLMGIESEQKQRPAGLLQKAEVLNVMRDFKGILIIECCGLSH